MNENSLQALRVPVERAVRPLPTSTVRKRRMREELLAHLIEVFEQELAATGDEQAALARTKERFGDPAELTAELARSVPKRDRAQRFFELSGFNATSTRSALKRSLFMAVQMVTIEIVLVALVAPLLLTLHSATQVRYALVTLLLATGTGVVFMPMLMLCAYFLRRAFFDSAQPQPGETRTAPLARWTQRVFVILASALYAPAVGVLFFSLISGDAPTVLGQVPKLIALGLATPACAALIGYQEQKEILRDQVWSEIYIAE